MPSYDSTGKRLSGAAQRRQSAENKGASRRQGDDDDAPEPQPLKVDRPPAPSAANVEHAIVWLAGVQAAAAVLAMGGGEPPRVRAINTLSKSAGGLRVAAQDSERAVQLLQHYAGVLIKYEDHTPPQEAAAISLWAFWRLVDLTYLTATQADAVDDALVGHQAKALALVSAVQPQAAIDRCLAEAVAARELTSVPMGAAA